MLSVTFAFSLLGVIAASVAPVVASASSSTFLFLGQFIFRSFSESLRQCHLFYFFLEQFLYLFEIYDVVLVDECYRHSVAVGTCRTSDAVHIVLGVARNVEVYHHCYVVDVYSAGNDVGCHEHVYLSALEFIHYVVALCLVEV